MLYTVEDLSVKFNVSKVTIYSKLKLDNIRPYTVKEDGKTKIKEEALSLIKESLKIKDSKDNNSTATDEVAAELSLGENLINTLNDEVQFLRSQLHEKDHQLERGYKLLENMQVLIKQEQDNHKQQLIQDQHYKDLDKRLTDLVRNNEQKMSKQGFFKRFLRLKKG